MTESQFTAASFFQFLSENRLMGSRCKRCKAIYLPPRPICIKCHSSEIEWTQMKGTGKLIAFTTIAVGTSLMIKEGYDRNKHYCTGIVELDEGPKVSARILGVDTQNPDRIQVGTRVNVQFVRGKEGSTVLAFAV